MWGFPQELVFLAKGMSDAANTPEAPGLPRQFLNATRSCQPQSPYRLASYSFGGVLTYELAQQLCASAETVNILAIRDNDVLG